MNWKKIRSVSSAVVVLFMGVIVFATEPTAQASTITSYGIVDTSTRTIEEIVEMALALPHTGFDSSVQTEYQTDPVFDGTYSEIGTVAEYNVDDALNALKMVRYLAGVSYEDVVFTEEYNVLAQSSAYLLAYTNQTGHYPDQYDSPDAFYEVAYAASSGSNLNYGLSNISQSVLSFMRDSGSNITVVGHRRWLLAVDASDFGIGYVNYSGSSYSGDRIALYVKGSGYNRTTAGYVAWPSAGNFPIEYFTGDWSSNTTAPTYAWSVSLGADYSVASKDSVEITLTRTRDGEEATVWEFDSETPTLTATSGYDDSMHLAMDDYIYGLDNTITFRPDVTTLGVILPGDVFTVEITGVYTTSGEATSISYEVDFFDLSDEIAAYQDTEPVRPTERVDDFELPDVTGVEKQENSVYFSNITAEQAYTLLSQANAGAQTESFLFLYYSSNCWYCNKLFDSIVEATEENGLHLYLYDNYYYKDTLGDTNASKIWSILFPGVSSITYPIVVYFDGTTLQQSWLSKDDGTSSGTSGLYEENYPNALEAWGLLQEEGAMPSYITFQFNVKDGASNSVSGASVSVYGKTYTTDTYGTTDPITLSSSRDYTYLIECDGYLNQAGTISPISYTWGGTEYWTMDGASVYVTSLADWDINSDNAITQDDATLLLEYLAGTITDSATNAKIAGFDLNGDDALDVKDVIHLMQYLENNVLYS